MLITINLVANYVIDTCKQILIVILTSQCAQGLGDSFLDIKNFFGVFIASFEHISHLVLVSLLLTLNM